VGTVKAVDPEAGAAGGARIIRVTLGLEQDAFARLGVDTRSRLTRDRVVLVPGAPTTRRVRSGYVLPATQATVLP
jgi:hypothetical protein